MKINYGVLGANVFTYCNNTPINEIDPNGTASYKNIYTEITYINEHNEKKIRYNITTTIIIGKKSFKYKYKISCDGIISFAFNENKYWAILSRGVAKTLAQAMYKVAKSIDKNFLKGRTIGGLDAELQLHYAASKFKIRPINSASAEMGALLKKYKGYDNNAWFFESANAIRMFTVLSLSSFRNTIALKTVSRYIL